VILLDPHHYPARLALLELYYLTGNRSRLAQSLNEWRKLSAGRDNKTLMASYDRRWNFVGCERMDNLTRAMQ